MSIPEAIIPILEKITEGKGCSIEFWNYLEGSDLIDMLFEFSSELMMSDIDEVSIPEGYKLLAYIFYWETNCQFSGWYAIENKQDELEKIFSCYEKVGLASEAAALKKASEVWFSSHQDHDKVGAAYNSIENEYSDEDERFFYLAEYFTGNADTLFYV